MNVLLDPFERHSLIIQAQVGHTALGLECRSTQPAQSTQAVVHGNIDDIALCFVSGRSKQTGGIVVL